MLFICARVCPWAYWPVRGSCGAAAHWRSWNCPDAPAPRSPVGAVTRGPEARATGVTAAGGGLPVANVIEIVVELLTRDRRPVGPIFFARNDLAQFVVLIHPIGTVRVRDLRALVGGVVGVIEGGQRRGAVACARGGRAPRERQPVQVIVCFGGGHHRLAVVRKPNLPHQGRIGKVRVGQARPD